MPTVIEWVKHLEAKIEAQAMYAAPFEKRYANKHVLPFVQREYEEVYGTDAVRSLLAIRPPRTGTAAVVVDAIAERLTVIGATSDDAAAAELVERAWEDCDLDVMQHEAHREALIKARSFAQVSRAADGERAIVGIDAPEQVAVHREQGPPYDVDAALKIWRDEWTGRRKARLWLPGRDIDLEEGRAVLADPENSTAWSRWRVTDEKPSRMPWVPVVEFVPMPRLITDPVSWIEPVETLVDIADLIDALMVFAGHFGAVPIRWVKGLDVQRDPNDPSKPLLGPDGKPFIGFNPRADHLWGTTSKDAEFGQFTPATLDGFVRWAEHTSARIRAKTAVASTYFSLDIKSHMSAELLKTDEAPMVRRANRLGKRGAMGQSWRRLMQMMLWVEEPSSKARVKPRWESPATRIETQDADVFSKLAPQLGPQTVAEKVLGWSPADAEAGVAEAATVRKEDPVVSSAKALMGGGLSDDGTD